MHLRIYLPVHAWEAADLLLNAGLQCERPHHCLLKGSSEMCVAFSIGHFESSKLKEPGDQNLSTMNCTWWTFRVLQEDLASVPGKEV